MKSILRNFFFERGTGAVAVEFALVSPVLIVLLFGIVGFGTYLSVANGVEQLAAEGARASLAGLSDAERRSLAQATVAIDVGSYPFLSAGRLTVASASTDQASGIFTLTLSYDASNLPIFQLPGLPHPSALIVKSAAIRRGGY